MDKYDRLRFSREMPSDEKVEELFAEFAEIVRSGRYEDKPEDDII